MSPKEVYIQKLQEQYDAWKKQHGLGRFFFGRQCRIIIFL